MLLLYGGKYLWTQSLEKTDMRWQYHYFHISVQYCFLFVIVYYWGGEVSLKTIFNHISHHFMVAGVQEDWDDVTKYTNLLSQCIPLSLIKFQILDPFSSVPIQIMRYFRHFDSLFFAPLWDLPAPIGNKSGSRDKIADQSRVGHVIQNSAQSQASTRMSWAWTDLCWRPNGQFCKPRHRQILIKVSAFWGRSKESKEPCQDSSCPPSLFLES